MNARPKFAASHVIHKSFARRSEVQVQGDASAVCELDLLAIRVWLQCFSRCPTDMIETSITLD